MKIRKLKNEDASLMLEWMHDPFVVANMRTNFLDRTTDDCLKFINTKDDKNLHLAIASDDDEYIGTVSLKNIKNDSAEFGITIRKCAMGKGYSIFAMNEMLAYGFDTLRLKYIYWCVDPENSRALRFYDKNGFVRVPSTQIKAKLNYSREQIENYIWYQANRT